MNWHFDKPNKESEEVVCCFAYIAEKDCLERGDFIFHEQRKKMIFLGNSGEYYNMDEIRCWIEEEAIFNDAYDAIKINSMINRHMDECYSPVYGCLISNEDKE